MRKHVLVGAGASLATVLASWTSTLALAAAIMNPLASRLPNQDVQVTWSPSTVRTVASYQIKQCPSLMARDVTCDIVGEVLHNTAFTDYSAVIEASRVISGTEPVIKIEVLDEAGAEKAQEWVAMPPVGGLPEPTPDGSESYVVLPEGCQQNIAVGQFPAEAIRGIVDAGGMVWVDNVGVYQLTVFQVGVHEDDARLADLRDFELECRTNLAQINH